MRIVWNSALASMTDARISLRKPLEVMDVVVCDADDIIRADPATPTELSRVHDERYVRGVLGRQLLNGFGTTDGRTLTHILAANGVMIRAVKEALAHPGDPIMAPVSGFHHAHYSHGSGYCTFNGMLAAVETVRDERPGALQNVLIIDGDGHYGDGTDNIIEKKSLRGIQHVTCMGSNSWREKLTLALSKLPVDLIIYQAGADAHEADPYGAGYLNDVDWTERDEMIFTAAAHARVPIAWNLAGGYNGAKTVALHAATAQSARGASSYVRMTSAHRASAPKLEPLEEVATETPLTEQVVDEPSFPQG